MMFSKKQLTLIFGFALTLSACWKPESNDEKRDAASFNISSFSGEDQTPNDLKTKWKYPTYKIMTYKLCLEDRSTTNKARGQKFAVIDPVTDSVVADDKTVNDGCMIWQEKLDYNYFAKQSYYIEVKRIIRATGSHLGERTVTFYVNPWASDRSEKDVKTVVYNKNNKIDLGKVAPKGMELKALNGEIQTKPRIWIADLNLKVTKGRQFIKVDVADPTKEIAAASGLTLDISFRPKVELYKSDGSIYWKEVEQGHFRVFSHLIATDLGQKGNERLILTRDAAPVFGRVHDRTVSVEQDVLLKARATNGRLEIALHVDAIDGPANIAPFEGVYRLEQASNLTGGFKPTIKLAVIDETKRFNLREYLGGATNFEELQKSRHALKADPFTFGVAKPRYLKVGAGETATRRDVEYMVMTCVIDNALGTNVGEGMKFVVQMADGSRKDVYADVQGCIRWNSKLNHEYYQPEKFFFEDVKIFDETGTTLIGKKSFAINPWDDKFTFGWDRLEMEDKFFDEIQKRELIPSMFYLDQFSYHTLRFRYEIDRFMNLQVKKTILLELHPQVLRYSGIVGGRKVTEDLRDGIYLLKVAIQKDYLDPSEKGVFIRNRKGNKNFSQKNDIAKKYYVDVAEKFVQVFDGRIITPIELSMSDLRLMRVRSQFLIQLETVDEEKIQVSNLLDEKFWPLLREKREDNQKVDEVLDDSQKEALEKEIRAEKAARQEVLTKAVRQWVDLKVAKETDFAKNFGLTDEDMAELERRLAVNSFFKFDLSPKINPNDYIAHDSGLNKRTFIGPMIFLSNAYGDSVRPTDSLNEVYCETNDCNYIEKIRREEGYAKANKVYEHNQFFGSIAHLANKSVDDFIAKKMELDRVYYSRMPQIASLGNFADAFNLNIISLTNERFTSLKEGCELEGLTQCEEPSPRQILMSQVPHIWTSDAIRLKSISSSTTPVTLVTSRRVEHGQAFNERDFEAIWSAQSLDAKYAEWVCYMIAGRSSQDKPMGYKMIRVYKECLNAAEANPNFMIIDRRLRVGKTGSYEFRGGKQMNLNVGSSFSIGHSNSTSISTGVEAFDFIASIPIVGKLIKPLSLKVGSSESTSMSDGTSVSEQTYLVMQMANFMVDLKLYERCFVLRPSIDWLRQVQVSLAKNKRNHNAEPGYVEDLESNGVMVCGGGYVKNLVSVMESYFYFTQHFTEGDMLDQYDLYNHPWLLALRGVRDFTQFAKLLRKQSEKTADWYSALNPLVYITELMGEGDVAMPWQKVVDKTGWPLDKMAETYRNTLPSFPGLYTLVHHDEFIKDYPWEIKHTDLDFFKSKKFDSEGREYPFDKKK